MCTYLYVYMRNVHKLAHIHIWKTRGKLDIYIYIYVFENGKTRFGLTRNDRGGKGGEGVHGIGWIRFAQEEETTCRNNVRVFDLRHVTEPH